MEEITLIIEGEVFKANKEHLCDHSDYFRAMFSGNYKEKNQREITIDVVDANSMRMILLYMRNGLIDLSDVDPLDDLALSANFLQMGELVKQIEYTLTCRLSLSNWLSTIELAEAVSLIELKQSAVEFGVLHFQDMKPEHIPTIQKLHWYLSHPYLEIDNEFQVFKFGFDWVVNSKLSPDAVLIVLGCLDMKVLTKSNFIEMFHLLNIFKDSVPTKIVKALSEIANNEPNAITESFVNENKSKICENCTEEVFEELLNLVKCSQERLIEMVPCIPGMPTSAGNSDNDDNTENRADKTVTKEPYHLYQFRERHGFEKWIEVAPNNLWGWSITSWGRTRLVVVGGEYGKGTGIFMREVRVYDTLRKQWVRHGVSLPPRRHAGVAVIGDSLYIVGGVGTFRVVLCSSVIYNLEERSFIKTANFPDAIQNPAICSHEGQLYVGGHCNIYRYSSTGERDNWELILKTNLRANYFVSFENHIYVTQNYFSQLFRFKPNEDTSLSNIIVFIYSVAAVCTAGKKIVAFTQTVPSHSLQAVEVFDQGINSRFVWTKPLTEMKVYDTAGCCSLVVAIPPVVPTISEFVRKYLSKYPES